MLRRQPHPLRERTATWIREDAPAYLVPAALLVASIFAIFSLLVLAGPPITGMDQFFFDLHLVPRSSVWHEPLTIWVMLGQRVPAMAIAGLYALYRARRTGSGEPLVLFGIAAILFTASVGMLKYSTGRIGPRYIDQAHTVWDGGNIYPSGHVTGTVALYGVMVLIAPVAYRRVAAYVTGALALSIGVGVIALNTHWASDVVGGYLDGALVLMIAWAVTPEVRRRLAARRYTSGPAPTDRLARARGL